ncbi:MAG TPA: TonB-dependent receptor [Allosphingosinicella sp.]|nr:TonB-dependent receptor [Allosphingosinicella sp.]
MRRPPSFRRVAASASLLAVAAAALPASASAQAAAQEDSLAEPVAADAPAAADEMAGPVETGDGGEDIVVTGSRIARPEFALPNPVQSFTSAAIEQSGETNLTDFLIDTPALAGSLTGELNSGSNTGYQTAGLSLLDLRNLGTARTLVLVNGRRHVNAYPGENSVDINTIPVDLIERVDILTGGASAIYGADGVSGVVNFVLKRDYEGLGARGQAGISELGDAGNRFFSVVAGKNFLDGRANIAASYEYNESDRLHERKRSYLGDPARRLELIQNPRDVDDDPAVFDRVLQNNVGWADSATSGAIDVDGDFLPDFDGNGRRYDGGTFLPGTGGRAVNGSSNTPTAGYFGDVSPYLRRHNLNLLTSFELSPALRLFAEGKYVDTTAYTQIQPSFDFFTFLHADNPFLPARIRQAIVPGAFADFGLPDGILVNRDNFDLGVGSEYAERETLRGVVGVDGEIGDRLRYELSYVHGRAKSVVTSANTRVTDRYFAALDAVRDPATGEITCRINLEPDGIIDPFNYAGIAVIGGVPVSGRPLSFRPGECVPLNLIGEGVASQAATDFVMVDSVTRAESRQDVVSGSLAGDLGAWFELPGGPIGFALGAEYRKESTQSQPSRFQQRGLFDEGSQILPSGGEFDVKEVFAEVNVPILADVPFAETLAIGGAVRISDYSTVGGTTTWKVDGVYAPVRDISFRATYSQAVRAPNITELFSPLQGTFEFLDDPCDPTNIGEGSSSRAANCLALLQGLGLTPEEIENFSPSTDPEQSTSQPGLTGGNPDLSEETARTWTAGVVLRPRLVPGLTIAADWYDIRLEDAINTATANELLALCVDQPSLQNVFCENIVRNTETGFVDTFTVQAQNVAEFTTSGLDLTLNYRFSPAPGWGSFNLRVVGGYLNDLTFVSSVGAEPDQDRGEQYRPKFIGTADLTWTLGDLTLNYGLSWQSRTRRFTTEELEANPDISDPRFFWYKERWEHDIQASYTVDDRFTVYGGINNFTDEKPAVAALAGYPVSNVGRFFYVGARVQLNDIM